MVPTEHPEIVKSYGAFTNQSLMLAEVTKAAELLRCGTPLVELRRLVMEDNLFQLRTEHSRKTFVRAARDRLAGVHEPLLDLLANGDFDVRRLTCSRPDTNSDFWWILWLRTNPALHWQRRRAAEGEHRQVVSGQTRQG